MILFRFRGRGPVRSMETNSGSRAPPRRFSRSLASRVSGPRRICTGIKGSCSCSCSCTCTYTYTWRTEVRHVIMFIRRISPSRESRKLSRATRPVTARVAPPHPISEPNARRLCTARYAMRGSVGYFTCGLVSRYCRQNIIPTKARSSDSHNAPATARAATLSGACCTAIHDYLVRQASFVQYCSL